MTVWFRLCLLSILKTKLSKPAFFHSCFTGGMKKPWLFSVYQGFYYPVMWGFNKRQYKDSYLTVLWLIWVPGTCTYFFFRNSGFGGCLVGTVWREMYGGHSTFTDLWRCFLPLPRMY